MNALLLYWRETGPQYLDVGELGYLTYVSSLKLSCEPELYDCNLQKQPIKVVNELIYVGNTSFKTRVKMYFPNVEKPVAQKDLVRVFVDPTTMRPVAPPAWWREKHLPYSRADERRISKPPFDFKTWSGAMQQEDIRVQVRDLNAKGHCDWVSFVWLCYEAYGSSQYKRFGRTLKGDLLRDVKCLVCAYKGEAGLGDLLKVFFLQDPVDTDTYHFQLAKRQEEKETVIFECHVIFFSQVMSKL
ncbi:hypothetical protein ElyMa_000754200 [Elysia marginata]|uniref:Uncharacterized protein n=1 Tax=Elysia marginata TaxID=1093978 RepID=A0AAV4GPQ0_9GAST|nr:hypothetical protein ElyMa_000754200 [Elysia marginata]